MSHTPINDVLLEYQDKINENTSNYGLEDFKLKLRYHKNVADVLEARDKYLREKLSKEDLEAFYKGVLMNFDPLIELLPLKDGDTYDFSFVKLLKAEYLDGFKLKVTLELNENSYVENKVLQKTFYLEDTMPETTKITWKDEKGKCPLLDFFENEEDDFELFDIFYEFYMNMVLLYNPDYIPNTVSDTI